MAEFKDVGDATLFLASGDLALPVAFFRLQELFHLVFDLEAFQVIFEVNQS